MAQASLTQQLEKANGNVKKLCEFFVARREMDFPGASEDAARELKAAAAGLAVRIRTMMQAIEVEPDDPARPDVESLGPGAHDLARVQRFTSFLRDLDTWIGAQKDLPEGKAAAIALQEMESHIVCMVQLIEILLTAKEATDPSAFADADEGATQAVDPEDSDLSTIVTDDKGTITNLVLDDTEEHPLVQEFQGIRELTPECERLADEFLASWDIELSYYNRKKFLERLLRWITSAPDGQVLVIKMKTIEEPYEPYPSYVSRDVLLGKEPPKTRVH
jgi:hypothetical protein